MIDHTRITVSDLAKAAIQVSATRAAADRLARLFKDYEADRTKSADEITREQANYLDQHITTIEHAARTLRGLFPAVTRQQV